MLKLGAMSAQELRENSEIEFANGNFVSTSINLSAGCGPATAMTGASFPADHGGCAAQPLRLGTELEVSVPEISRHAWLVRRLA